MRKRIILGGFSVIFALSLIATASSSANAAAAIFNVNDDQDTASQESYAPSSGKYTEKHALAPYVTLDIPPQTLQPLLPPENGIVLLPSFSTHVSVIATLIRDRSPPAALLS